MKKWAQSSMNFLKTGIGRELSKEWKNYSVGTGRKSPLTETVSMDTSLAVTNTLHDHSSYLDLLLRYGMARFWHVPFDLRVPFAEGPNDPRYVSQPAPS
jgi:hypothetical protein